MKFLFTKSHGYGNSLSIKISQYKRDIIFGFTDGPLFQKPHERLKMSQILQTICIFFLFFLASCTANLDEQKKADAFRRLGEAYMAENRDAAAFIKLKEAEKLSPKDPHIHFVLGVFYYKKEQFDLSIKSYRKCLKIEPDFSSARNNLGVAYLAKGEYDTAISCFSELLDKYAYTTPYYPLANLGQAYFHKKEFETAEKYFHEALEMKPEFALALHWLGRTDIELGKPSEAVAALEKAASLYPSVAEIHFDLGRAFGLLKDYRKAALAYKKVVELNPDSSLADRAENEIEKIKIHQIELNNLFDINDSILLYTHSLNWDDKIGTYDSDHLNQGALC